MVYELIVCIGISIGGCGDQQIVTFDRHNTIISNKLECYSVLDKLKLQEKTNIGSLAYCRPVEKGIIQ